ncbi:hypothetical protein BH24ACT23_BH24ACT23_11340 [soil metagenome]
MIVTWPIGVRIAAIVVVAVLLQISFFSWFQIFGASPDVVPVAVASIGLLGGAVVGGVVGFGAGFLMDSVLLGTLGVSSLVLIAVGYLAGRYRESFEIDSARAPAVLAGALGALAAAGFTALQLTLGVDGALSGMVVWEVIVKGFFAYLLMYAVHPAVRAALRSALVLEEHEPRRPFFRRRRQTPTRSRSRQRRRPAEDTLREARVRGGVA